ncbi:DUF4153 domain-containing protein [Paenirhodobacter enshiensis]|uniref:DUF4153 domain-containing protein n=1 Tax=Paenirhodobacter enshiensis TaxID=1105367 RepID=UPI0035B21073
MMAATERMGARKVFARRAEFVIIGLLAGASFWRLTELPWSWQDSEPFLATAVMALSFFGGLLAMLGALGLGRALTAAAAISVPAGMLVLLKARDFADPAEMLATGHVPVALMGLVTLPVPFAIALMTEGRRGWRHYGRLFTESWNIVVRYAAAWLFVGVVWGVLWLLWSLLDLVGVEIVGDVLTRAPVVWLVSGAVMGLALAVVTEMADTISADLLLRLLRLLLPLVLLVEVVFVAVLPASGLSHLFGVISPTGIVVATALASIGLVTIAVDAEDACAAQARALTLSARGLALLLPVLAGLALWSLGMRVAEHGWTPERVGGAVLIALICGYALCYAVAVLRGARWRRLIRQANIAMALIGVATAAVWMTPLLSAERIAVASQIARYDAGTTRAAQLPLAEFAKGWGAPGRAALETLRQRAAQPGQDELVRALARFDGTAPETRVDPAEARAQALALTIAVLPAGTEVPPALLARIAAIADDDWAKGCARRTPAGHPACLLLIEDLTPGRPGRDALFVRDAPYDALLAFREAGNGWASARPVFLGAGAVPSGMALIDALSATGGATRPADLRALPLDAQQLSVVP